MIGMVTKQMFFDRDKIRRKTDSAARRVLSRFGAFVRTAARSSIRTRKKVSDPGKPPSSHGGELKRGIFFGYDPKRETVVIGPVPLHGRGYKDALEALEYGGTVRRHKWVYPGGQGRARLKPYRARYRARPFMQPAFEQERPKLPAMWRDSVR